MEQFKSVIQKRYKRMILTTTLMTLFIIFACFYGYSDAVGSERISDFIKGFQVGGFVGVELVMLVQVAKCYNVLKNPEKLKALYIEENDERTKHIQSQIGATGFTIVMMGIALAILVAAFFSTEIFFTLFGVLIFVVSVKAILKLYYYRKY